MVQPPDIESVTPQMTIGGKRIPLEVILRRLQAKSTHICRHSFGTLALMASRDLSAVQAALGHSDIRETQRYAKVVALMDGKIQQQTADFIGLNAHDEISRTLPLQRFARTSAL